MTVAADLLLEAADASGLLGDASPEELLTAARRARRDALDYASSRLRLPRAAFYRALAERRGLPFVGEGELAPDPSLPDAVPPRLLERKQVLPLSVAEGAVRVATADPDDRAALEGVGRLFGLPVRPVVAAPDALRAALEATLGRRTGGGFDAVGTLDALLREAYLRRASDVHLDPQAEGLRVRLRVDGRLQDHGAPLPPEDAAQLVSRVKVLAGLDIAERREPQDGGFRARVEETDVDVRVATIPSLRGERATLRLLGVETRELTLERLGFPAADLERFREVLARPHGLVLLTGPTGSGKTTTLYAALRALGSGEINVMTVEDPVEFALDGVTQVQVGRAGKVTFAGALRSLLRHDPDVVMVGEVRDAETAAVALRAALTGHLVLSSLHTNDAPGAVTRLLDLGCERYLVASTLRAVIAQRLVRRLCRACRVARPAPVETLALLGGEGHVEVFAPRGCPVCSGTGYRGRLALVEALWFDATLAEAVARGEDAPALVRLARERGYRTLREDGRAKVLAGETTLEEAARATA
ncbi:MAG: type II/IV secretion system protein [Planctomycetota bacterium]|nr:MAG: type II/IV secretion system protein [Planctomycetota bacterium]